MKESVHDGFGDRQHGTHGWNGFYSVPWGYWTATLSAYSNTYYQHIAGVNQTFVSSGNSQTVDAKRSARRSSSLMIGASLIASGRVPKTVMIEIIVVLR